MPVPITTSCIIIVGEQCPISFQAISGDGRQILTYYCNILMSLSAFIVLCLPSLCSVATYMYMIVHFLDGV